MLTMNIMVRVRVRVRLRVRVRVRVMIVGVLRLWKRRAFCSVATQQNTK